MSTNSSARNAWISRTPLSGQAASLRLSLLVALGLSQAACGGTVIASDGAQAGSSSTSGDTNDVAGNSVGGNGVFTPGGASNGGASNGGSHPTSSAGAGELCSSPTYDPGTGLESCDNGIVHRRKAATCSYKPAEGGVAGDSGEAGASGGGCRTNADCADLPFGLCPIDPSLGGLQQEVRCEAGCQQDSDCPNARDVCVCSPFAPAGRCLPGGCKVDADCGPDSLCAEVQQVCGNAIFGCTIGIDDCTPGPDGVGCPYGTCSANAQGRYVCQTDAVCGRPFIVADQPRLAPVTPRSDWRAGSLALDLRGLSPLERTELAAHWSRLGQMEHASIAAFARFNLQLLSLGAPSELIEACNQALIDETAHTRLCFGIASGYAGMPLGPSKLEVRDCFEDMSLTSIVKLVLREGCLGETVAALEAREDSATATDPVVRAVLERIASDEERHAELAYRFLAWALAQSSAEVRAELQGEADQLLSEFERDARSHTQSAALREVVRPLVTAVFAQRELPHAADLGVVATTA